MLHCQSFFISLKATSYGLIDYQAIDYLPKLYMAPGHVLTMSYEESIELTSIKLFPKFCGIL